MSDSSASISALPGQLLLELGDVLLDLQLLLAQLAEVDGLRQLGAVVLP